MAKLSEFGKDIGKRLIDLDKPQVWLIEEVRNRTGLYFDDSYLYKIKTGQLSTPKVMVLPDEEGEEDGSPVCIYTLDPRDAFVIYYSGVGHKPLAGVLRQWDEDGKPYQCVYTREWYFEIAGGEIKKQEARTIPYIPIIEYTNNDARMGAFEVVLPLLNAINTVESNRVDSIQDFVNAFDVFQNCEIDKNAYKSLSSGGMAVEIKGQPGMEAKVYRIASELNQTNTQTLVDDLYDTALTICGMPNRNGGSSTSDTGTAVIYRDGFAEAESRAKDTEKTFIRSEREFLRIVLYICRNTADLDLQLSDIKPEFTRKNLSNIQSKAQVLAEMLNNMAQRNLSLNPSEFYAALNMIYSDFSPVAKKHGLGGSLDFYVDMAKAFLNDKDAAPGKISNYYNYIVK